MDNKSDAIMRGGMRRCVLLNVTDCITLLGLSRSPQEVTKPIHPFVKSDVPPLVDKVFLMSVVKMSVA